MNNKLVHRHLPPASSVLPWLACSTLLIALASGALAVDLADTRMLTQPTLSEQHVAFTYADDLWIAPDGGGTARRLTSAVGTEQSPRFSPDGQWIAFSGEYDGNVDVFVIPAAGGVPRRLTWHPGLDLVQDWSPDGSKILFASQRSVFTNRFMQLFEIDVEGSFPERLPIPNGLRASYSPDGSHIAYIPIQERFGQWKGYRGGTTSRIWVYDRSDHSVLQVPQPESRCNDTDPVWVGSRIFFRSDRAGELNLFSFDTRDAAATTDAVVQHTTFDDFGIERVSGSSQQVVFEQAGYLHVFDPSSSKTRRLQISVAADLLEHRARWIEGPEWIRGADLSPSGARAVFEYRGEILTLPREKGDSRNLTLSPGAHERSPAWSPDGNTIAYFSDESGEYRLHLAPQDGRGEVRAITVEGNGFYDSLEWSPDSKKLSYIDNSQSLYWVDIESGKSKKIASEPFYRPGQGQWLTASWAPDSQQIAYTIHTEASIQRVWVHDIGDGRSRPITDGLSEVSEPVFDSSGKYLYFLASTDAGPVKHWFAMSNSDASLSNAVYVAVLSADEPSPLAPESDEEPVRDEERNGSDDRDDSDGESNADDEKDGDDAHDGPTRIDFARIQDRILALPIDPGLIFDLRAAEEGRVLYRRLDPNNPRRAALETFTLEDRETTTLGDNVAGYTTSADGKHLLFTDGNSWGITKTGKISPGDAKLAVAKLRVRIEPKSEWRQIFDEAWRINRDYFYDPNMHGADWQAMGEKYSPLLDHLSTRSDLNRVLRWMSSELAVGHHNVFGGDERDEADRIPGGLLGADFQVDQDRYRFETIYGGLNWNHDLRSPLTEPGVGVEEGDYLIAVDGRELRSDENLYSRFENTAETVVELEISKDPDGSDSRTVNVVPIRDEYALRNRDWVEDNLRKVDKATNGRVAYVYVPNTTNQGHTYFKRYFFPQVNKDAIIVDERFNGGGQVADYYIDHLRRPFISHWATRYGADIKTPSAAIFGPKVMIIDETAGSGGDLLPWMFRKLELGTLVGKRTWGGLVGVLGFPVLMDGGLITAPNLAIWTEDGFVVENVGVPPDVEVEQWPAGSDRRTGSAAREGDRNRARAARGQPAEDLPQAGLPGARTAERQTMSRRPRSRLTLRGRATWPLLALLASLIFVSAPAGASELEITYLANAGFLLDDGERKVLIDALFGDGIDGYPTVPWETRERLEAAEAPFDGVDLVLVTHHHGDHFDAEAVARFLDASPRTQLISTPQVRERLLEVRPELERRGAGVLAVLPEEHKVSHVASLDLLVFNLHHGRDRQPPVQNVGFLITMGGQRILHIGDTEVTRKDIAAAGHDFASQGLTIGLLTTWFLSYDHWADVVRSDFRPSHIIGMHMSTPDAPASFYGPDGSYEERLRRIGEMFPEAQVMTEPGTILRFEVGDERSQDP